ncbi:Zinc finger CCCH domain-containing protein 5, partial [Durusdinium trenchii]
MLPRLDLHGGRGLPEKDTKVGNTGEAVVTLPRLRLLRQVTSRDEAREARRHHVSPRSPSSEAKAPRAPARGRGMVRPGRDKGRSPSPMRRRMPTEERNGYVPQHDAQQRVRQHMRQKRRKAKEEEELRAVEEKERQERVQKSMPQVEAYRRELARKAAELHRREKVAKETAAVEQEQLASARRERVNRYITPDVINTHLGRLDASGEERRPAGSSVRALREEVVISGSFATGSVRARHKVMLSPRRQDRRGPPRWEA